jgi:hypothetical protein
MKEDKMKTVTVQCPSCDEISDLYLGSEAFMIILNCPNCGSPLMYYYGKTFEINEEALEKIQKSEYLKNIGSLLKEISKCGIKIQKPKKVHSYEPAAKLKIPKKRSGPHISIHLLGQPVRAEYFTKDDLLDLKIEIETSRSVRDFLSKI